MDSRDIGLCLTGGPHGDREHHKHYRHPNPASVPTRASKPVAQKSGSNTVDILFLYTPGAASYMGDNPSAFINNLVASLNTAFSASGVTGSVRAVYYGLQTGVSSMSADDDFFNEIEKMHDGTSPFTGLAGLRNDHFADVVVLLADRTSPSKLCGVAGGGEFIPLRALNFFHPNPSKKAYAVVSANCADDDRTFHHEVGHLLGGWHDVPLNDWGPIAGEYANCGIDSMSCGYTDFTNGFRTIMGSLEDTGFDCDTASGCPRLLRFSDLAQTAWINGGWRALGQPMGTRDGYEDFVGTLNGEGTKVATISFVAGYRAPTGSAPGAPTVLDVETCYSLHTLSWSGATGTVGWHEVETGTNASYAPATNIYRGDGSTLLHTSTTSIRTRVRACNAVGCSTWKTKGPSNPATCL